MAVVAFALLSAVGLAQVHVIDKTSLTPAQRKIDSQLLRWIQLGAVPKPEGDVRPSVRIDEKGRVLVDIRVDGTDKIEKKIADLEGTVVSTSVEYLSITAWIPLKELEALAEDSLVRAIQLPATPSTNR